MSGLFFPRTRCIIAAPAPQRIIARLTILISKGECGYTQSTKTKNGEDRWESSKVYKSFVSKHESLQCVGNWSFKMRNSTSIWLHICKRRATTIWMKNFEYRLEFRRWEKANFSCISVWRIENENGDFLFSCDEGWIFFLEPTLFREHVRKRFFWKSIFNLNESSWPSYDKRTRSEEREQENIAYLNLFQVRNNQSTASWKSIQSGDCRSSGRWGTHVGVDVAYN